MKDKTLFKKAETYLAYCEQNPKYLEFLFSIYTSSDSALHRIQALNCVKSLVERVFSKKYNPFENKADIAQFDNLKKYIRESNIQFLGLEFDPKYRKILNVIFSITCYNNLNNSSSDLFNLANSWFTEFENVIKNNGEFYSPQNFQKLKTITYVLKMLSQKKLVRNLMPFVDQITLLCKNLENFITYVDQNTQKGLENISLIQMKFIKTLYKSGFYLLCCGNPAFNLNDQNRHLSMVLFDRTQTYLKVYVDSLTKNIDEELYLNFEAHCVNCVYSLSSLVVISPLVFGSVIKQFMEFTLSCFQFQWKSNLMKKAIALLLYKTIKSYIYYSQPDEFSEKFLQDKNKNQNDIQRLCYAAYYETFGNTQNLQTILQVLIGQYFTSKKSEEEDNLNIGEENIESFLEDEERPGMDMVIADMEDTCPRIGSSILEQIFTRFPQEGLGLYLGLIADIMKGNVQMPDKLVDQIFAQLCYLSGVYQHWKIPDDQQINLLPIFEYLFKKGETNLIFNRRAIIVLKQLINSNKISNTSEMYILLNRLLLVDDYIVQFEVMRCLFMIIRNDQNELLDHKTLLKNVIPVFVKILKKVNKYNLLFRINEQFCNLLERSQNCLGLLIRR